MANTAEQDQYGLPSTQVQQEAGELTILDEQGTETPFKTLYPDGRTKRHLIVFIRHFYCGQCEDYVRALTRAFPPPTLATASTTLTIIGCGSPPVIPEYKTRTACPFPIYCDPTRALYLQLGMTSSLSLGDHKPEYSSPSLVGSTVNSFWNILKNGRKGWQGGDFAQNGGEWVFEGGEVRWCRRMRHTRDHAEVREVKEVLGMEEAGVEK